MRPIFKCNPERTPTPIKFRIDSLHQPIAKVNIVLEAGMEPVRGYQILEKLGQGGFGEVWLANSPSNEEVALKFVHCKGRSSLSLSREVRVLLRLRDLKHPYIIDLKDVIATSNYLVLVMELADGNLSELQHAYLQETGRSIPPDHLLEMLEQAADALDFLANQADTSLSNSGLGMQHCDVKPSNLLILGDTVKVADFGLCMSSMGWTQGDRLIGTPPYAAPELYKGKPTSQTDQYGLAVSFCELCTNGRVFVNNIADSRDRPILPINPDKLRTNEADVILKALDSDWTNRWGSCTEFVSKLKEVVFGPRVQLKGKSASKMVSTLRKECQSTN